MHSKRSQGCEYCKGACRYIGFYVDHCPIVDSRPAICKCCNGTGRALSALGAFRPCSRCQTDDFSAWYRSKVPLRATEERND